MASPTRRAALALLTAVLQSRRPLEEALDALPAGMAPRDRGAGHRIAATVLRRMGSLDAALEPWLKREPPPEVRNTLRIGAAELLLLGTPPHAAVSDCVALVPKPFAGLVNAVLRRVSEAGVAALEGLDAPRLDTPSWLWSAWHATHGPAVRAMAEAHGHEAPLDLSLMPGAVVEGTVSSVLEFGATVQLANGLVEGLLHVSQVSELFVRNMSSIVAPGDVIQVVVIKVDPKDGSISLSTKRLEMTPGEIVRNASAVFERVRLRQRGQGAATSSDVDMRLEA